MYGRYTGWAKSRFMIVSRQNTEFILVLLFINYCLIFHKTTTRWLVPHPVCVYTEQGREAGGGEMEREGEEWSVETGIPCSFPSLSFHLSSCSFRQVFPSILSPHPVPLCRLRSFASLCQPTLALCMLPLLCPCNEQFNTTRAFLTFDYTLWLLSECPLCQFHLPN